MAEWREGCFILEFSVKVSYLDSGGVPSFLCIQFKSPCVCLCARVHVRASGYMCACMYACVCVCVHVCTCVSVCACAYETDT